MLRPSTLALYPPLELWLNGSQKSLNKTGDSAWKGIASSHP